MGKIEKIVLVKTKAEMPVRAFKTEKEFETWLSKNHNKVDGIWLQVYKKDSEVKTISMAEALDVALCYGWIDGQRNKYDDLSYIQKLTPRRARSIWSKRNTEYIERLTKAGRMKPGGLAEVEKAKADGRWDRAYDKASEMTIPADFMKELSKNKKALLFFESLNKTNKFAIGFRLQTAKKEETRLNRMKQILEMMKEGKKFH